jgi:hypothetical protein
MYNFEDGEGLFGIDDDLGLFIAEQMSSISTQSHPDHKEDIFNKRQLVKGSLPRNPIFSSQRSMAWRAT